MSNCNKCNVPLTEDNWQPSFRKNNSKKCRRCNNTEIQSSKRAQYHEFRKSIFKKLNNKCACCKISNKELLSIDHIYGGGIKEKEIHRGRKYMKYLDNLSLDEFKNKYQLLCYNCNCCKEFYGVCFHKINPEKIDKEIYRFISARKRAVAHLYVYKSNNWYKKLSRIKLKLELLNAYGGKCNHCSEEIPLFMTIDHVDNNGFLEKENGCELYLKLKKLGFPTDGLQLLCHNCNSRKEYKELRKEKSIQRSEVAINYTKTEYFISKEKDRDLWDQARNILNNICILLACIVTDS